MKQLFLDMNNGKVTVQKVPPPAFKGDGVIVENHYSVISGGTENSTIQLGRASYLGKAKQKPELLKKVVQMARKQGPLTAYQAVKGTLDKPIALGYSSAGIVKKVKPGLPFSKGDRVACGGQDYASHSDMIFVPEMLTVKVPDNVSLKHAAFTTIGAIAMQGVRNADVRVGERVGVIGLGLIGQITIQILKAAGCKVLAIDIDQKKIDLSKELGADEGSLAEPEKCSFSADSFSRGYGLDSVIITAATLSNQPLVQAGEISRKRGRIVLVGVVGMEVPRDIFYEKEVDFIVSNSYGPGRKDPSYEERGHDYPFGYVRWTEKRNMEAFMDLLSDGKINLEKMISHEFEIDQAGKAYEIITGQKKEPYLGILLSYDKKKEESSTIELKHGKAISGNIGIGWIGAGSFATTTLLPAIKKVEGVTLIGLSAGSGISTKSAAEKYGFEYCTSDYNELLNDERIQAVIITTRNSLHAKITGEAVKKGKHVFVEKPLAIKKNELDKLIKLNKTHPDRIIQVGFNRRYAPMTVKIIEYFKNRNGPMIIHYRINAGKLPKSHWVYEDEEGGSRFISEMCHFIDFCQFVTGHEISSSSVHFVGTEFMNEKERKENLVLSLSFNDGSLASIIYNTIGEAETIKEYIEIESEGSTIKLFDFREMHIIKSGRISKTKDRMRTDKGHKEELIDFVNNIKRNNNPFKEYIKTTRITFN